MFPLKDKDLKTWSMFNKDNISVDKTKEILYEFLFQPPW